MVIVAPPERSASSTSDSAAAETPDLGLLSPMHSPRDASLPTGARHCSLRVLLWRETPDLNLLSPMLSPRDASLPHGCAPLRLLGF